MSEFGKVAYCVSSSVFAPTCISEALHALCSASLLVILLDSGAAAAA